MQSVFESIFAKFRTKGLRYLLNTFRLTIINDNNQYNLQTEYAMARPKQSTNCQVPSLQDGNFSPSTTISTNSQNFSLKNRKNSCEKMLDVLPEFCSQRRNPKICCEVAAFARHCPRTCCNLKGIWNWKFVFNFAIFERRVRKQIYTLQGVRQIMVR